VQWWCSSQGVSWTWAWKAYPGVWLFIILLFVGVRRWNGWARARAETPVPLSPMRSAALGLALATLWIALDWPIGALGAGYLASVHMLQFLLIALIASPLLLVSLAPETLAVLRRDRGFPRLLERVTRPVTALLVFNAVIIATHVPAVVDTLMASQLGNFAIDLAWLVAGLVFWWPVVCSVPARPRFVDPLRIGYLAIGIMFSPVSIGLSAFLVYSSYPLFRIYELAPPIAGLTSHEDHQIAGLLMSVAGSFIAMGAISVIFFRWSKEAA
jgi:cytochrome c oxidase assembly factor CtaG